MLEEEEERAYTKQTRNDVTIRLNLGQSTGQLGKTGQGPGLRESALCGMVQTLNTVAGGGGARGRWCGVRGWICPQVF